MSTGATSTRAKPAVTELLAQRRKTTDLGNAERLADRAKARLRWVYALGWLVWDGRRWKPDKSNSVLREAMVTARGIYGEAAEFNQLAATTSDDAERQRISTVADEVARWARASESRRAIEAMVKLAEAQPRLVVKDGAEALDADPNVLNVNNGILGLGTLELDAHDPKRLLTKVTRAAYDPTAEAPFWHEFLELILPDEDVREWVQMAAGYSLLGTYSEFLFIPWGGGQNGKSTFLGALRDVLGDYASEANAELLVAKREFGAAAESALAGLRGKRFVTTVETEQGKRMAEVLVKQLTGEGEITAKFMRRDYFTYTNQAAVWLATNHKPIVQGMDLAMWRRIRLIPFDVTIPEDRRLEPDDVRRRLQAERDGILRWLIEGLQKCRERGGLNPPPEVVTCATEAYKAQMDPLKEWLEDECELDTEAFVPSSRLRQSYETHCHLAGRQPLGANRLTEELSRLGFAADRDYVDSVRARVRRGLRLRSEL